MLPQFIPVERGEGQGSPFGPGPARPCSRETPPTDAHHRMAAASWLHSRRPRGALASPLGTRASSPSLPACPPHSPTPSPDAPRGSAQPERPRRQRPPPYPRASTAGTARRWRPLAPPPGRRGRERREAEDAARAAPWGPEDGVTAQPAMPDGSPPGRPDSAEPWAFAATPGAQRPLPSDPSSRGPRRLGSTRTPKAPLTLTLFLSPRVGAVTNSRSTLPTPREADRPGEDGVGARE